MTVPANYIMGQIINKTRLYVDQHSSSELIGLLYTAIGL